MALTTGLHAVLKTCLPRVAHRGLYALNTSTSRFAGVDQQCRDCQVHSQAPHPIEASSAYRLTNAHRYKITSWPAREQEQEQLSQ